MISTVYYNQSYKVSLQGTINAILILPLLVFILNNVYKDIFLSFVMSFAISSFICLFHFTRFDYSLVFYAGFALMISGLITFDRSKISNDNIKTFIQVFCTILLCGITVYFSNIHLFNPITEEGKGSIFSLSFISFTILFVLLYAILFIR